MKNNFDLHFIISAPRSGSTWLTTALNHHPEIFATEQRLFGQFCEVWKNNDGSSAPRITFDSYARAFAMHYFYGFMDLNYESFVQEFQQEFAQFMVDFAQRRTGKKIVVDKITPYPGTAKLVVQQIRKLFPESTMIQLVRDGRDVLTSGTFDWLLKDAAGTARHDFFVLQKTGTTLNRFFDDAVIEKWANNWLETITAFENQPTTMRITYEAMQADFQQQLATIFDAIGAAASAEIARVCASEATFEKMSGRSAGADDQPTAKARKGIIGDWRNYFTRTDGQLFDRLTGDTLVELGYESNRDWFRNLPETLSFTS